MKATHNIQLYFNNNHCIFPFLYLCTDRTWELLYLFTYLLCLTLTYLIAPLLLHQKPNFTSLSWFPDDFSRATGSSEAMGLLLQGQSGKHQDGTENNKGEKNMPSTCTNRKKLRVLIVSSRTLGQSCNVDTKSISFFHTKKPSSH